MVVVEQCRGCGHLQIIWTDNNFCRHCGQKDWGEPESSALRDTLEATSRSHER